MKARRIPQEGVVPEAVENLQEIIWNKINASVRRFVKTFIKHLLEEGLSATGGADRYGRSQERKSYRNGYNQMNLLSKYV